VSIGTFQRVTGPKVDTWLVKTTGALIAGWMVAGATSGSEASAIS